MVLNKRSVSDFKKDKLSSPIIDAMPKEIDMEEAKEKDPNNLKQEYDELEVPQCDSIVSSESVGIDTSESDDA